MSLARGWALSTWGGEAVGGAVGVVRNNRRRLLGGGTVFSSLKGGRSVT